MVLLKGNCRGRPLALPAGSEPMKSNTLLRLTIFPFLVAAVLLLLSCLAAGCGEQHTSPSTHPPTPLGFASQPSAPTSPSQIVAPAVGGLAATLEDGVRDLPDGQIIWTTHWKLCWEPYAGALEYELEPMTGEGTRRRLLHQAGPCYRIEVAKGQNAKAQGLFNRDLMLASVSGGLAYRVRAVLGNGRVSQWSASMVVGQSSNPALSKSPAGR